MSVQKRVAAMEESMDVVLNYLEQCDVLLSQFNAQHQLFMNFRDYYGSEEWHSDRQEPLEIKRGVLSEDVPYDVMLKYREVAIQLLEQATQMLKDY